MSLLQRMVLQMSKEEIRFFKIYTTRMISASGRKDLQLFDKIRKEKKQFKDDSSAQNIYGKKSNSYYRLKHRLSENINDYLILHHYGKGTLHDLNRDWALFNIYVDKKDFETAYHFLKRAEQKALRVENWGLLELIYTEFIRLSSEIEVINPNTYISKLTDNSKQLKLIQAMDQAVASLSYRLRVTQNFAKADLTYSTLLKNTLKKFSVEKEVNNNPLFQTRLYRAMSQIMLQRHDYKPLANYVLKTYEEFGRQNWFAKDNHEVKLQMLTYIANSFYRLGNYTLSLKYTEILKQEIVAYSRISYDKFVFFFYNLQVLNYMKTDLQKALQIIEQMEVEMRQRKIGYYDQFVYVNKAIVYHSLGKPDSGIRNLVKLYVIDSFKKADVSFRLKIVMLELIMQFESGEVDSFIHRIKSIRKEFGSTLLLPDFSQEKSLLILMEQMLLNIEWAKDKKIVAMAKKFIKGPKNTSNADRNLVNYEAWVQKRLPL